MKRITSYPKVFCFEAKEFDSSITNLMVRAALRILREHFYEGMHAQYDVYRRFVEESLLRTVIYRDDGHSVLFSADTSNNVSRLKLAKPSMSLNDSDHNPEPRNYYSYGGIFQNVS